MNDEYSLKCRDTEGHDFMELTCGDIEHCEKYQQDDQIIQDLFGIKVEYRLDLIRK